MFQICMHVIGGSNHKTLECAMHVNLNVSAFVDVSYGKIIFCESTN